MRGRIMRAASETPSPSVLPYIALNRGRDYFIFRYSKGNEAELISTIVEYAQNEDLNFTWSDVLLILRRLKM
ncbi:MAG TPA: hypothetical protein VM141_03810 [Planctomycetota bacterium]|nr:hypothetical protein [Planctomycetota bacterium]